MKRIELNGKWQFKAVPSKQKDSHPLTDVNQWMPASVPGTVHTDLLAAGKIPDPFYRTNEIEVQWVDKLQWLYRREFHVGKEILHNDAVSLVAEGLDTFARVVLNGKQVGQTADMFVEHRFNVKRLLKTGKNVLEIVFDSPSLRTQQLERTHGALQVSHEPQRVFARKAQYSFGWDWGPKLTTSGIWRNIYLEAFSVCRIKSIFARALSVTTRKAQVRIDVALERAGKSPVKLKLEITGEGFELQKSFSLKGDRSSISFAVPRPHLWWPNGHGEQPLYRCRVWVESEGVEIDEKTTTFGIRTVRLVRENEAEGQSFIIEVNGKPIFCKGMDWIPCDNFIPRISDLTYERLLSLARDAHATMIRVWGGGIYEQDMFYELCDRFGLMVWQDFMFACGEYPEDRWFLRLVQDEAEKAVTRLRNHPSLSLWCGNNECEWIFCRENPGKTPDAMTGAVIFNKLLPSVCRALDGTRPYWRSSPFGEGFPNAESSGNHHQWSMWGEWIDYKEYEKDCARFVTEFGFQAPPNTRTIEQVTIPSDRYPQSMVLEHHNKLPEGTERLFRFIAAHYAVNGDFEDYVYKGQLVQAEALKTAVEHWRRRKFKTAGSLFWQLNDCWPVTSWSVIDSALRPKAAYFYSKKFFAPLLVSFKKGHGSIEVWATSDLSSSVTGELKVSLLGFDGVETWSKIRPITLGRNASKLLLRIENAATGVQDPTRSYLLARLQVEGVRRSENRFFFAEPKHVRWQPASVTMELAAHEGETYLLTLSSQTLAKNVRIDVEDDDPEIDDNFFDLDPGESKTVRLVSRRPEEFIRSKLRVRTLWS